MGASKKIIIGIVLLSLFLIIGCEKQIETDYSSPSLEELSNQDSETSSEQDIPPMEEQTTESKQDTSQREEQTTNGPDVVFDGYPEPFIEGEIWTYKGQVVMGDVDVTLQVPLKNRGNLPTSSAESDEANLHERVNIEQFIITLAAPFTIEPPLQPGESRIITIKKEISDWPEDFETAIDFFQQIHDTGHADATITYESENVQDAYLRYDFTVEPRMYDLQYIEKECKEDSDCENNRCSLDFECE